ncbi:MAG TPA: hypothetical protein VG817_12955 [Gemmatimonadales bacterium]|nr:hypothetical protein [Gemmatimonadales bacterium]
MIDFLLLPLLMTVATWLFGWWGILLVGLASGWLRRQSPAWRAALAAAAAWGFWLILAGPPAAMLTLLEKLSQIFGGVPIPALLALPPLYAALLAWAAARLGQGLPALRRGPEVPSRPTDGSLSGQFSR